MVAMLDDIEELKRRVAEDERTASRAAGAAAQLLSQIKEKFGVKDEDAARALLRKLAKRRQAEAEEYAAARKKYDEEQTRDKRPLH